MLSATGTSHPFNEGGPSGYVRADGYGAVIIRRMTDAEADGNRIQANILNVVAGAAGAADGEWRQYVSCWKYSQTRLVQVK